jgi:hypothetical protein
MKFLIEKEDFIDVSYEQFESLIDDLEFLTPIDEALLVENKLGDWLFRAPKIRRFQMKANERRIQAAHLEMNQRREIEQAVEQGKNPDRARMWELLQNKLDSLEAEAREYEEEARRIAEGNDYLRRVQRVAKLKGSLTLHQERYSVASDEEKRELSRQNNNIKKIISDETKVINDKIASDADKLKELKQKEIDQKKEDLLKNRANDVKQGSSVYFTAQKANDKRAAS